MPIIITVPLTDDLVWDFCSVYRLFGCTIVETNEKLHVVAGEYVYDMRIYRFTFPDRTQLLAHNGRNETLVLPSGICIDIMPFVGHSFLYLYVDYLVANDVLLPVTKGGVN